MSLIVFDHRIQNIPCQIEVTYFHHQPPWPGSPHTCDSDMDYYGYTELEYNVLDRNGRRAEWLEKKLTKDDESQIEQMAKELLS